MVYVKATADVVEEISYMAEVEKIYKNRTHKLEGTYTSREIKYRYGFKWGYRMEY